MIYIDKVTGKRVNPDAPYKGFSRLQTPEELEAAGVIGIAEDAIPDEFVAHPDWYLVSEDWEAVQRPYTVFTRKDDAVIADIELTKATTNREAAYKNESDPLFFKEQRKEVPEGTWLAKVAEIKARYPK